jgi:hypothetical protein
MATRFAGQHNLPSSFAARCNIRIVQRVGEMLVVDGGRLTTWTFVYRHGLRSALVRVGPVTETAQAGLLANLSGNMWEDRIQTEELVIEFIIGARDDMVFFVGGQHQVRDRMTDAIIEQSAILAFLELRNLWSVLFRTDYNEITHP